MKPSIKNFIIEAAISTTGATITFGILWYIVDPNGVRDALRYSSVEVWSRFGLTCIAQGLIFATASHIAKEKSPKDE